MIMNKNPSLADVRARRAEIAKTIGPLQAEDKELAIAESALVRLFRITEPTPLLGQSQLPLTAAATATATAALATATQVGEDSEQSVADVVKKIATGKETLEELIILLFTHCVDPWWTAQEVQENLSLVKGKEVPMASVSPTLTNMKNKNLLVRDGLKVALPAAIKNKEAAAG
jgi:hypothetical protein